MGLMDALVGQREKKYRMIVVTLTTVPYLLRVLFCLQIVLAF